VLSLYLNTQPDQHGRDPDVKAYLQRGLKSLARTWPASSPQRQSFDRDVERPGEAFPRLPELADLGVKHSHVIEHPRHRLGIAGSFERGETLRVE